MCVWGLGDLLALTFAYCCSAFACLRFVRRVDDWLDTRDCLHAELVIDAGGAGETKQQGSQGDGGAPPI